MKLQDATNKTANNSLAVTVLCTCNKNCTAMVLLLKALFPNEDLGRWDVCFTDLQLIYHLSSDSPRKYRQYSNMCFTCVSLISALLYVSLSGQAYNKGCQC